MTAAEELAAAAEKLRKLATNATPGPWRQHDTHLGQYGYTATVVAIASWLDSWTGIDLYEAGPLPEDAKHALAVARAINGDPT